MSGKNVHYIPLLQTVPSDDEDDVLEFGRADGQHNGLLGKQLDAIPLRDLRSPAPSSPREGFIIRNRRKGVRKLIVVVVVGCLLVIGAIGAVLLAVLNNEFNSGIVHSVQFVPYGDWTLFFNNSGEEGDMGSESL